MPLQVRLQDFVQDPPGAEVGEMLTTTCENSGCGKSVSRQEMLEFIENSGGKDYPFQTWGRADSRGYG